MLCKRKITLNRKVVDQNASFIFPFSFSTAWVGKGRVVCIQGIGKGTIWSKVVFLKIKMVRVWNAGRSTAVQNYVKYQPPPSPPRGISDWYSECHGFDPHPGQRIFHIREE